jgi:hypothetical protein
LINAARWIKHKYKIAVKRGEGAKACLDGLTRLRNPFSLPQINYTSDFFKSQWEDQRNFQQNHSEAETEERERLAAYLDQQATLDALRYAFVVFRISQVECNHQFQCSDLT